MNTAHIEISDREEAGCVFLISKEEASKLGIPEFAGEEGESYVSLKTPIPKIYAGMGEEKSLSLEGVRRGVSSGIDRALSMKLKTLSIGFQNACLGEVAMVGAIADASVLATYVFSKYKPPKNVIERISIKARDKHQPVLKRAILTSENANFLKEWISESPTIMNTAEMEKLCREVCEKAGLKVTVFGEEKLREMGMEMILAVGRGASSGPRMILAEYNGGASGKKKIALVGKGITFDSGGMNLKPTGHIETMKIDKAGALTVLAAMKTAAELKLNVNIIGIMPFCENMIGPNSYKPGDILRSYSGKTVEITNTDAEGRLILGDALAYAVEQKPDCIIDLATLTGACVAALGEFTAGLFSSDKELVKKLYESGEITGERVWHLPLHKDYSKEMEGNISDLKNALTGRVPGAVMGAAFLQNFVGKTPWAHLDIAGTAWWDKKRYYVPQGPTGWGVRLLADFLEKM